VNTITHYCIIMFTIDFPTKIFKCAEVSRPKQVAVAYTRTFTLEVLPTGPPT
jgi:hypothetical protein